MFKWTLTPSHSQSVSRDVFCGGVYLFYKRFVCIHGVIVIFNRCSRVNWQLNSNRFISCLNLFFRCETILCRNFTIFVSRIFVWVFQRSRNKVKNDLFYSNYYSKRRNITPLTNWPNNVAIYANVFQCTIENDVNWPMNITAWSTAKSNEIWTIHSDSQRIISIIIIYRPLNG